MAARAEVDHRIERFVASYDSIANYFWSYEPPSPSLTHVEVRNSNRARIMGAFYTMKGQWTPGPSDTLSVSLSRNDLSPIEDIAERRAITSLKFIISNSDSGKAMNVKKLKISDDKM